MIRCFPTRSLSMICRSLALAALASSFAWPVGAQESLQYNRDIQPILADNCFACHGADSASRKADLRLDQRQVAIDFAAIVPGKPDESEIVARILSDDPDLVMPPPETKKALTAKQKETLRQWIAAGAEYQPHWSLLVPQRHELPQVNDQAWVKNPIDRFVLAKLEANGLKPAAESEPKTLFRRLHFDITGLPPAPDDVKSFVADYSQHGDAALSEWIDRLMNTPAWGEHRARYWLDAARYGDTHGLHFDNYREMWPYRDWVIRSFNANQPFDQFTVEQLAGDLLPNPTLDQLIATGFQRCNITTNEGGTIDEENLANYAVDRVQTFGWVYLGLTTNCAQCHNHKFDPITTRDFYSLAAYFRNTTQPAKDGNVKDGRGPAIKVPAEADRMRFNALPKEIEASEAKLAARKNAARGDFEKWLASATQETADEAIPVEGLLAHVPLNEGKGNETSNSLNGEKFAATGAVNWQPGGKLGSAPVMKLGGTFDLGGLGDFDRDQGFSYGAWIKAGNDKSSGGIIARMDEQAAYRGWDLWQQQGALAVHVIDSWPENALKVTTTSAVLKPGQWQHVFATYDGSGTTGGIKIYVDGMEQPLKVENGTMKPEATIRTATPLRLGQRSHTQAFDGGSLQDFRLYSRTLSGAEVQSLHDLAPLRSLLAIEPEKRTAEQLATLYDHFLATHDAEYASLLKATADLKAEQAAIEARSPVTHVQEERMNSMPTAFILKRGEYDQPTEQVTASPLAALHDLPEGAPTNRLGLAQWVVDPANPLTARVTVNRFWYQVFGQGIVDTTEDFGVMGSAPSHPELLDYLAIEFRESGWNVKQLFKLMLTSATYRQAAVITPEKLEKDSDNNLLSRGPHFRMDAEMVRDTALQASGLLSHKMYGPGVKPYQPEGIWDIVGLPGGDTRNYVQDKGEDLYRRSLYSFWKRMAPPPNLEAFNAPSREVCTVRRERTNTPLQALVTLNDPLFVEAARQLAQKIMHAESEDAARLNAIAWQVLSRSLNEKEQAILLEDKQAYLSHYQATPDDARALLSVGESPLDEKLDAAEMATWTMICNQVMNLDEALTK